MLWMSLRPQPPVQEVATASSPSTSEIEVDELPPIAPAAVYDEVLPPPVDRAEAAISAMKAKLLCSTDFKGTRPHVAQVGHLIQHTFGLSDIGGAHGRSDGDHGAGLALDFMVADVALGNSIAEFLLANKSRLGVTYVIWQQRYNDGNGWSYMEDRGSSTANHYDHVHVSFSSYGATNLTC